MTFLILANNTDKSCCFHWIHKNFENSSFNNFLCCYFVTLGYSSEANSTLETDNYKDKEEDQVIIELVVIMPGITYCVYYPVYYVLLTTLFVATG